jgi:hypothetical protein
MLISKQVTLIPLVIPIELVAQIRDWPGHPWPFLFKAYKFRFV